jgi:hypothetical protein
MSGSGERVEPLKKIALTVTAGNSCHFTDHSGDTGSMEFVYGVGPDGLTPFEYALADAGVGESITVQVEEDQYETTFGHLQMMLPDALPNEFPIFLKVRVDHVEPAHQREIIRAMAEASSCNETCCGH